MLKHLWMWLRGYRRVGTLEATLNLVAALSRRVSVLRSATVAIAVSQPPRSAPLASPGTPCEACA